MGVFPKNARLVLDRETKSTWGTKSSLSSGSAQIMKPEEWSAAKNLNLTTDDIFNGVEGSSEMYSQYEMVDSPTMSNKLRPKDYTVQMFSSLLGVMEKITNGQHQFKSQFVPIVNGETTAFTKTETALAETNIVASATPANGMTIAAAISTPVRLRVEVTNTTGTTSGEMTISVTGDGLMNNQANASETLSIRTYNNQTRVFYTKNYFYFPAIGDLVVNAAGVTGGTAPLVEIYTQYDDVFVDNDRTYLLDNDMTESTISWAALSAKVLGDTLDQNTPAADPTTVAVGDLTQNIPGSAAEEFYLVAKVVATTVAISGNSANIVFTGTVGANTSATETIELRMQAAGDTRYYRTVNKFKALSGASAIVFNGLDAGGANDNVIDIFAVPVNVPALNKYIYDEDATLATTVEKDLGSVDNADWNDDGEAHKILFILNGDDANITASSITVTGTVNGKSGVQETITGITSTAPANGYGESANSYTAISNVKATVTSAATTIAISAYKAVDLSLSYQKSVSGVSQYKIHSQIGNPDNPPSLYGVIDQSGVYNSEFRGINMSSCAIASAINTAVQLSWGMAIRRLIRDDTVSTPGVYDPVETANGGFPFLHKNLSYYLLDAYESQILTAVTSVEGSSINIDHTIEPIKGSDGTAYPTAAQFGNLIVTGSIDNERDTVRWKNRYDGERTFTQVWKWSATSYNIPGTSIPYELEVRVFKSQVNADPDPNINQADARLMSTANWTGLTDAGFDGENAIVEVLITTDESVTPFT